MMGSRFGVRQAVFAGLVLSVMETFAGPALAQRKTTSGAGTVSRPIPAIMQKD